MLLSLESKLSLGHAPKLTEKFHCSNWLNTLTVPKIPVIVSLHLCKAFKHTLSFQSEEKKFIQSILNPKRTRANEFSTYEMKDYFRFSKYQLILLISLAFCLLLFLNNFCFLFINRFKKFLILMHLTNQNIEILNKNSHTSKSA